MRSSAARLLVGLACACVTIPVLSAQDLSYLRRMPSNETVEAKIRGTSPLETAALRSLAFQFLLDLTIDLAADTHDGPNAVKEQVRQPTGEEYAVRERYDRAYWKSLEQIPLSTRKTTLARYYTDANREQVRRVLFTSEDLNEFQQIRKRNLQVSEEVRSRPVAVTSYPALNAVVSAAVRAHTGAGPMTASPTLNAIISAAVHIPSLIWFAIFGGLTLVATLADFATFRVIWTANPPQLIARRRTREICSASGHVVDASKYVEQHLRPGYTERLADGTTRSVAPSSYSTTKDQIFFVDSEGVEHALQLTDWNLAVRPGHRLSMISFRRKGKTTPYLAFHNHDTRDTRYFNYPLRVAVRTSFTPGLLLWLGLIVQILLLLMALAELNSPALARPGTVGAQRLMMEFALLFAYVGGWIVFMIARAIVTAQRLKRLKSEIFGRIFADLAAQPAGVVVADGASISKA